jgi:hypothetical protein
MSLSIESPPVPLRVDEHGVMRVCKTLVPLDTVVYAFNEGGSPEEIVLSDTTLNSPMCTRSSISTSQSIPG